MGSERALTVLSFNIHHGADERDRPALAAQAEAIRASGADLVFLQEVDRGTRRSGGVDQLAELAARTGLSHSASGRTLEHDGGDYGNAVLARVPLAAVESYLIPLPTGTKEPRGALYARADIDWASSREDERRGRFPLHLLNTHLPLQPEERLVAAGYLLSVIERVGPGTLLLGGDLNAGMRELARRQYEVTPVETDPALRVLRTYLEDTSWFADEEERVTYPAEAPVTQLDFFLVRPGRRRGDPRVVRHRVLAATASDHRPVRIDLALD